MGTEVQVDQVAAGVVEGGQDDFARTRQDRWARFHTRDYRLAPYADLGLIVT
jgi:hypothetical protein